MPDQGKTPPSKAFLQLNDTCRFLQLISFTQSNSDRAAALVSLPCISDVLQTVGTGHPRICANADLPAKASLLPCHKQTFVYFSAMSDVRTRILEAAGEIFAEKGFRATTVREICRTADANIAAINYYFGDKNGLYVESVKHAHACRFSEPPPQWPPGTAPEQKLRDFLRGMLRNLLDPTRPIWNAKLMMRELAEPTAACQAITEQYIRPMAVALQEIITEMLPANASADRVHLTCFSVVGQCLFYRVQEPVAKQLVGEAVYATFTVDRIADHITDFTLAALGRRPAPAAMLEGNAP